VSTVERRLSAVATMAQEHGHPTPNQRARPQGHRRTPPGAAPQGRGRRGGGAARRGTWRLPVGWYLMLRRSELAGLCLGDVRWHPLAWRSLAPKPPSRKSGSRCATAWTPSCARCAVRQWTGILAQAGHTEANTPLLCRLTRTDALPQHPKALSAATINNTIKELANQAGLTKREQGPATDTAVQAYTRTLAASRPHHRGRARRPLT
jgi:hypothetical protein